MSLALLNVVRCQIQSESKLNLQVPCCETYVLLIFVHWKLTEFWVPSIAQCGKIQNTKWKFSSVYFALNWYISFHKRCASSSRWCLPTQVQFCHIKRHPTGNMVSKNCFDREWSLIQRKKEHLRSKRLKGTLKMEAFRTISDDHLHWVLC